MIYVLKSAGYDENNQYIDLLKIGYSKDWRIRKAQYLLHNPTIKILYEVLELEEEWEHKLHYKFKKYRYKDYGNEWFYYRDEILEYFKTHDTPNLIREDEDLKSINRIKRARIKQKDKILVERIITLWLTKDSGNDEMKFHNNSLRLYGIVKDVIQKSIAFSRFNVDYVYDILIANYNVPDNIIQYIKEELDKNYPEKIQTVINNFNFSYTTWEDRMRYLCSQKSILSEEEYNTVLNLIPIEFKNYLTVFDVSKIGTCKYRQADLKKEFDRLYGSQVAESKLQDIILSLFKVGGKYTKAEIKEKLGKIYLSIGYSFTPKATDLENWFEIKEIQWRENGKKVAGFEIIKKKGD